MTTSLGLRQAAARPTSVAVGSGGALRAAPSGVE